MKSLIVLVSLFLVFSGCTKSSKLKYGVDRSETLINNLQTEPPSLDWHKGTDTTSSEVVGNIMEGLTALDFDDPNLKPVPALALNWQGDKASRVWTFTLREDVKWTDGVLFEAQQVADGWERLLNPKTAAQYSYFLYPIKNAKAYNEGKIKDFSQVGIKILAKNKIQVTLEEPMSFFPSILNHHSTFPIRKDIVEKFGDRWTNPENIVTLGAYKLSKWDHDDAILLERNENYFGEKAKTKYVLERMIQEQSSALNAFDVGDLDILQELPSTELGILKKRKEYVKTPLLGIYFYGFNIKQKPLDDANIRRAIAAAIDKKEIIKVLNGEQIPGSSFVPNGMLGYEIDVGIPYNVEKAKEYLAKSSYKTSDKVPKITLLFNTNENHQKMAENVQAQLKKNLGLNIELKNEEWKVLLDRYKVKKGYGIYRLGWIADYSDPDNFMQIMTSYSENNHTNWQNPQYDELVKKALSEQEVQKRKDYYKEAQKILLEEAAAVVPIYTYVHSILVNPRVRGYKTNPMDQKIFKTVELVK